MRGDERLRATGGEKFERDICYAGLRWFGTSGNEFEMQRWELYYQMGMFRRRGVGAMPNVKIGKSRGQRQIQLTFRDLQLISETAQCGTFVHNSNCSIFERRI